jgi:hypothetical protein
MVFPCSIAVENVWGPQVHGCGTDFDLTLLFQEVVLFIAPLGVATSLAGYRISQLVRRKSIVASPVLYGLKLVRACLDCPLVTSGTDHGSASTQCGHLLMMLGQIGLLAAQISTKASLTQASISVSSLGIAGYLILLATILSMPDRFVPRR